MRTEIWIVSAKCRQPRKILNPFHSQCTSASVLRPPSLSVENDVNPTHVIAACVLNVLFSYHVKQLPERPNSDDKLQTGFIIMKVQG